MAEKRRFSWRMFLLVLLGGGLALLVLSVALLPKILPMLSFEERVFELGPQLTSEQRALVTRTKVSVDFGFVRSPRRDLSLRARGRLFDWPYTFHADLDYSLWHRKAKGTFSLLFDGTPWRVDGSFGGSTASGWTLDAATDPLAFDAEDPVLGTVLTRAMRSVSTNLTFTGSLGFEAHAAVTNGLALPTWTAQVALSDVSAAMTAAEKEISLSRFRMRAGVKGLGSHVDIDPLFPRADEVAVAGVTLTNVFASVRATEKSYLVTEAGADVYGGQVRLYALFLNPERLNAGVTLFLDDIDTGLVLNCLEGFQGTATGRLHGKIPLRLYGGERIGLGDAYLYSTPGEVGTLSLNDPTPVLDNLAIGGIDQATRENFGKALQALDYTALNIQLRREDEAHALSFKLQGSATSGKTTVPVSFDVTFRGDLEQLINTGLKATGGK